jgi:hypothetical protein
MPTEPLEPTDPTTTDDLPDGAKRLNAPGWRPRLTGDMASLSGEDCWVMPWGDLEEFLAVAGGETAVAGGTVSRTPPLSFKEFPLLLADSFEALYEGWDAEAIGEDESVGFWSHALLRLRYTQPEYELSGPNAYLSFSGESSGRILTIPEGGAEFSGGSNPVLPPQLRVPSMRYYITIHRVPMDILDARIALSQSLEGCVNLVTFRTMPASTVLYDSMRWGPESSFGGARFYRLELAFDVSTRVPWNYDVTAAGDLEELTIGSGGDLRYPEADLSPLLII